MSWWREKIVVSRILSRFVKIVKKVGLDVIKMGLDVTKMGLNVTKM